MPLALIEAKRGLSDVLANVADPFSLGAAMNFNVKALVQTILQLFLLDCQPQQRSTIQARALAKAPELVCYLTGIAGFWSS